MHEALGKNWWERREVGARLKALFSDGQKIQPDEIARAFGADKIDFRPTEARVKRLLGN
jgi:hypothetical protein